MSTVEERLANLEHERWAGWQEYLHKLCMRNEDGSLAIPKDKVKRWERQIATPYEELSEEEKESDRIEARKTLKILQSEIAQAKLEAVEELERWILGNTEASISDTEYGQEINYEFIIPELLKNKLTELKSSIEKK